MNGFVPAPGSSDLAGELLQLAVRMLKILAMPEGLTLSCKADALQILKQLQGEVAQLPRAMQPQGLTHWQMQRVTAYMIEQLDQPNSLDELAALLKLSRWHFCTSFHLASGKTPREWLINQRMHKARQLLSQTQLSIMEIALAVGYRSSSAFTAQFHRNVGVPPTRFRRQC